MRVKVLVFGILMMITNISIISNPKIEPSFTCLDVYKELVVSKMFIEALSEAKYDFNLIYFQLTSCWELDNFDTVLIDKVTDRVTFQASALAYLFFDKVDRYFVIDEMTQIGNELTCKLMEKGSSRFDNTQMKQCFIKLQFIIVGNQLNIKEVQVLYSE